MEKKPFVTMTSMVPVLACIAALLFSANFYQFLQMNFKKWWGWDFTCPVEQVDCHRYEVHDLQEHRRHRKRHDRPHRHDVQERHTIILELSRDHEFDRVQEAERHLQRNLERALRDLQRLRERMEWNANTDANRERLETEIRIKAMNLQAMERIKHALESHSVSREHQTEDEIIQEFHFDNNVEIRIRKHQ